MPGLIRGVARTAAIAGTATVVSNGVSRRQTQRWADKDYEQQAAAQEQQAAQQAAMQQAAAQQAAAQAAQQQAAAAPAAGMDSVIEQLGKLGQLRDAGVLTEAEFEAQKAKLLG